MKYSLSTRSHPSRRTTRRRLLPLTCVVLAVIAGIVFGIVRFHHASSHTPPVNTSLPAPVVTTPAPATSKAFGIAAGSGLTDLSAGELDQRMAGIQNIGVSWVRLDFDWSKIQPQTSTAYTWDTYDKIVAAANKHNLKVLGIITYTPSWARKDNCDSSQCPPADNAAFAVFAGAVAGRYRDQGVHSWEIWNEPNSPDFWKPKADPAAYTDLLAKSSNKIHQADKSATVITAGLSPQSTSDTAYAPADFLTALYKYGAKPYFDAVADHPYTFPLSPASSEDHAWNQMATGNGSMRGIMVKNGDSAKKIWITEFGSPTGGPGAIATIANPNLSQHPYAVDQALQAKILTDAINLYKGYDWVGPFFYYSYQDAGTTNDTNENFFGLITASGDKKQAYSVLQQAATTTK